MKNAVQQLLTVFVLGSTPAQWRFTEGWIADKTDNIIPCRPLLFVAGMGTIFGHGCFFLLCCKTNISHCWAL